MSGIFAKYQPRYAEQNVITFPVGPDKKPAVKNWQKIGLEDRQNSQRSSPTVDTFGFPLGPRSGVTILDVDTKDERAARSAVDATARSPFVVETGGGYHAYYRYSGERRHIRPWGPDIPIDVLGNGYAVGAPSVAAKGPYKIIRGTLEDLKNLPPLHAMLDELRKPIPEGKRNQSLFRMGLEQAPHADDFETLMDVMRTRNMDCTLRFRNQNWRPPPALHGSMSPKAGTSWGGEGRCPIPQHLTE